MRFVKAIVVGIAAALLAPLLYLIGDYVSFQRSVAGAVHEGVGFVAISVPGWPLMLIATVAFALGFWWQLRRARRTRRARP